MVSVTKLDSETEKIFIYDSKIHDSLFLHPGLTGYFLIIASYNCMKNSLKIAYYINFGNIKWKDYGLYAK